MRVITKLSELRDLIVDYRSRETIGFVPTMGYLHAGHLALVNRSKAENAITVVSIFVNPLQFGANEDLHDYPHDVVRDTELLEKAGADILFFPTTDDMIPRGMKTVVNVPGLGDELEGAVRPGHFAGVATIVTRLFNLVQPHRAYFGEKDYQQVLIIRQMVEDLAQPVSIVTVPTVREPDGLACSSRNTYLTDEERKAAIIVPHALHMAERLIGEGCDDPGVLENAIRHFIETQPLAVAEVVAVRDPCTLATVENLQSRRLLIALFVRVGKTRLLDNRVIDVEADRPRSA